MNEQCENKQERSIRYEHPTWIKKHPDSVHFSLSVQLSDLFQKGWGRGLSVLTQGYENQGCHIQIRTWATTAIATKPVHPCIKALWNSLASLLVSPDGLPPCSLMVLPPMFSQARCRSDAKKASVRRFFRHSGHGSALMPNPCTGGLLRWRDSCRPLAPAEQGTTRW